MPPLRSIEFSYFPQQPCELIARRSDFYYCTGFPTTFAGRLSSCGAKSEFDSAFEHEIGRTFERNILEIVAVPLETHFQNVSALDLHLHRRLEIVEPRGNQRRCCYTSAAGQRFSLHTPFVGTHADRIRSAQLHKIHVGSFGSVMFMIPNFRAER